MKPQSIVSGIQPTGQLTLGNYLGAIRHWVKDQERADCFFVLVDLHALTVPHDPSTFRERCLDFVAQYLACGIDPAQSTVFVQSHVAAHAELAWLLQCNVGMGALSRMTQYKDKVGKSDSASAGLFTYPVLMAADILLYGATHVPVGDDQKQHLELARDIAQRFNQRYGETFTVPEPAIAEVGCRIMSLGDPTRKMSKSDPNPRNVISLLDPPDTIVHKLNRAVTDSGSEIVHGPGKPGVSNLLEILSALTDEPIPILETSFANSGYGSLKAAVADATIALLEPIQARFTAIRGDEGYLHEALARGADRATQAAQPNLEAAKRALGLLSPT